MIIYVSVRFLDLKYRPQSNLGISGNGSVTRQNLRPSISDYNRGSVNPRLPNTTLKYVRMLCMYVCVLERAID